MRPAGTPDCFCVINGPEDGVEFNIVRTPFTLGTDFSCAVNLRLDNSVHEEQARATVVPDGYRLRSIRGLPIHVNGKRAGELRSRIVRAGDVVQLGHTLLVLDCAPDGLASRSRGIDCENDLVWTLRHLLGGLWKIFKVGGRCLRRTLMSILLFWKSTGMLGIAVAGLYFFYSPFHNAVNRFFLNIYYGVIDWFTTNLFP